MGVINDLVLEMDRARGAEARSIRLEGFGSRVKAARKELGLKQQELARAVGVHLTTMAQVEAGSRDPSLRLAREVVRVLAAKGSTAGFGDLGHLAVVLDAGGVKLTASSEGGEGCVVMVTREAFLDALLKGGDVRARVVFTRGPR